MTEQPQTEYRLSWTYLSPFSGEEVRGSRVSNDRESIDEQMHGLRQMERGWFGNATVVADSDRVWDITVEQRESIPWSITGNQGASEAT